MKIGYIQFNVKYKNIADNINTIVNCIRKNTADLFVAPELCLTGYLFQNEIELIQLLSGNDNNISQIVDACKETKRNIIFGHAIIENQKVYNTAIFVDSNGTVEKYRKIHLSKIEKRIFSEGEEIPVFKINNVKIGINICYDLWIPEMSRILFNQGVQVMCCPCNFGGPWTYDIARTRAMENKMFYVIANRIGSESNNGIIAHFRGESRVYDYSGDIISRLKSKAGVHVVEINENLVVNKETIMSDNIVFEANKYCVIKKSLTTAST